MPEEESEYSPWGFEFKRMALICDSLAELSIIVRNKSTGQDYDKALTRFVNMLEELYDWIRPLVYEKIRKKIERKFKLVKINLKNYLINRSVNKEFVISDEFLEQIFELKRMLLDLRQKLGLALKVKEKLTDEEKISRLFE
ncbi:MAG: hypothetical protein QW228_06000 [Candidatus Aenigmatarchaeota archaeon]